ncbi:V-type proton ATPase subunit S1 [Scaptodrosophila lebanonensis]|uniref:V-type proton ATPase subunit S1 n=1 Tax=Drosophila lebanonensis TaxID=7225 RepID=A0A6J2TKA8_DROLE|nr:V-type proton ATPase subunit S1 [Scaptodrosophila lebanonensis]XP_030377088.1 V-type proton ATPase subunit S1 [Scaptodrosophila lebanonensis]
MLWKMLIASLCVMGVAVAEQSPVFLWGANSLAKPALRSVPQTEFADEMATLLNDHMVVAFKENNLINSDFLCENDKSESCYVYLRGVSPKNYYSNVQNPTEALRSVASKREHNTIDSTGQFVSPVNCTVGTALFVTFDDVKETRAATLESHDAAISSISKQFNCNVAYLYLAAPTTSPVVQRRTRRDVSDTAAVTGGIRWTSGNQFIIFYTALQQQQTAIQVTGMQITNSSTPNTQFSVSLQTSGPAITFDIVLTSDGYYNLENLQYNNIVYRTTGINAPTTFSYFCGNLTLEASDGSANTLTFSSLQFQAPFNAATPNDFSFGDAWHCVGFVTPAILMGLLVVALLLGIMFVGVCWMMDINTMDRFDDPKGKTITINAGAE